MHVPTVAEDEAATPTLQLPGKGIQLPPPKPDGAPAVVMVPDGFV